MQTSGSSTRRPRPYTTSDTRTCRHCERDFNAKGYTSHEKRCKALKAAAARDRAYEELLALEKRAASAKRARIEEDFEPVFLPDNDIPEDMSDMSRHIDFDYASASASIQGQDFNSRGPESDTFSNASNRADEEEALEEDDIKVEYHPGSERSASISHFRNFTRARGTLDLPPEEEPFRPFRCRADFRFARTSMEAGLKPAQIDALIKIIYDVANGERFTLAGHGDLAKIWKVAADILTPFEEVEIEVPLYALPREDRKYKVWLRPLWDWTLDLLSDSRLLPHFTWDAERLYKYEGFQFVRFFNEPWTGDRFWNIQSSLPVGANPFCWVLYADKNKLSSFGTAKGYPVIARCANLPTDIRNGNGIGGGRVVGWLPVMKEESAHKGKMSWKNHKRAVWHAAFREMLKSLVSYSKTGYSFTGADDITQVIYPCVLILSGDYEEQTFMTLICGLGGYCPCPVCYVPAEDQADLSVNAPIRTTKDAEESFNKVRNSTFEEAEKELQPKGLRRIANAFWEVANSDPYKSASWDRLHSYSLGIFGDHMWSDFRSLFKELGREARAKVDEQFSLMPRFRNLYHFKEVIHITFNDGSKFEDLSKQLLFTAHNVLTKEKSGHGYKLMKCLRSFLILDTLLSFEVHTEDTIKAGEAELQNFAALIRDYVSALPIATDLNFTYNWSFIKMHYQKHTFEDIRVKGASRNYSTKPNKNLHKPMRDAYHQRTNFKAVEMQILNVDHYILVSMFIQSKLDELDEFNDSRAREAAEDGEDEGNIESAPVIDFQHHYLGSPNTIEISALEERKSNDLAYTNFRKNLGNHLTELLQAHSIPLPNNKPIRVSPYDKIIEYKLLKVKYENLVTWKLATDYLRCNPKFFGHPRYDAVIVRTVNCQIFARLICMMNCIIDGESYPTALIQPCDAAVGRLYSKDIDLKLIRVKAKPRISSEFISIRTIIRGAVLVPDFDKEGDYYVMDVVDADMFLRVRKMQDINVW